MAGCSHIWRAVAGRPPFLFAPAPVALGDGVGPEAVVGGEVEKAVVGDIGDPKISSWYDDCPVAVRPAAFTDAAIVPGCV